MDLVLTEEIEQVSSPSGCNVEPMERIMRVTRLQSVRSLVSFYNNPVL